MSTSESAGRLPFTVEVRHDVDGTRHVAVVGELDLDTCPELDSAFSDPVEGETTAIDLSGVTFMDSAGLRCLVRAARHHASSGAEVRLVAESEQVRQLLKMSGLYDTLREGYP